MDEWQVQRNDDLVREIDRLIVEAHPEFEYALDGKSCVRDAAPVTHGKRAMWCLKVAALCRWRSTAKMFA